MKLLLDQNLSHRIVPALQEAYPDSIQVRLLEMDGASDKAIWDYAKADGYAILPYRTNRLHLSAIDSGQIRVLATSDSPNLSF